MNVLTHSDLTNFMVLIGLGLFGFGMSLHIGTNGETVSFESLWTSIRALIYATLGEIDYEQLVDDPDCLAEAEANGISWKDEGKLEISLFCYYSLNAHSLLSTVNQGAATG